MGEFDVRLLGWAPLLAGVLLLFAAEDNPLRAEDLPAEDMEFFEKRIRPILAEHCFACHSAKTNPLKGGLRLDSREGLMAGGASGAAVVPTDPEKSRPVVAGGGGMGEAPKAPARGACGSRGGRPP